jgi:endoglucanase
MPRSHIVSVPILLLFLGSFAAGCGGAPHTALHVSTPITPPASTGETPLHTSQGQIVDAAGNVVHLTGVNWFGFETTTFAPHGLQVRNWRDMLAQIVHAGFNTIRLPYSNQLFDPASVPQGINYQLNPDLVGLKGLALLDRIVRGATQLGLRIILDQHRPDAYAQSNLWYTDHMPESRWMSDWVMLAKNFRDDPLVIGADLHNEPHGQATWGDGNPATDWRLAAERAGDAILAVNPHWLIIVEGIENYQGNFYWWGGNLEGAGKYPVQLSVPNQLVYSAHDYGPELWNQSWFQAPNFPLNLPSFWQKQWAYLQQDRQTPVLIGEFGAQQVTGAEGLWMRALVTFLKVNNISYTYWCWNPDSGDTGGILEPDWKTINTAKLDILSAYQWPIPSNFHYQPAQAQDILQAYI